MEKNILNMLNMKNMLNFTAEWLKMAMHKEFQFTLIRHFLRSWWVLSVHPISHRTRIKMPSTICSIEFL